MNPFPYTPAGRGLGFTGIPSAAEWVKLTTVTTSLGLGTYTHNRTNVFLLAIDRALTDYHQSVSVAFNASTESPQAVMTRNRMTLLLVLGVCKACRAWLDAKTDTKSSHRRDLVQNLYIQCTSASRVLADRVAFKMSVAPGAETKTPPANHGSQAARLRWRIAKEGLRELGMEAKGGLKGKMLHDDYWKEANIGGANPAHAQGHALTGSWNNAKEDDRFLFDHVRRHAAEVAKLPRVEYVAAADRWNYQIVFSEGKLHARAAGSADAGPPIHTRGSILIIDNHDVCYTSLQPVAQGHVFHHSSIPAGRAVKFAGGFVVTAGVLQEVDNASGHYRPEKPHLLAALQVLQANGVELARVRVLYQDRMVTQHGLQVPHMFIYNNAATFLSTKGECAANSETPPPT